MKPAEKITRARYALTLRDGTTHQIDVASRRAFLTCLLELLPERMLAEWIARAWGDPAFPVSNGGVRCVLLELEITRTYRVLPQAGAAGRPEAERKAVKVGTPGARGDATVESVGSRPLFGEAKES